jgi:hypothetical protein
MELDVTIAKIKSARTKHKCVYCTNEVKPGEWYMKFTVRKKDERFPISVAVCKAHKPALIPLSVIIGENNIT